MKWKYLLACATGFAAGVLACILIASIWGPKAEDLELDLYSGQQRTISEFLWSYRISQKPDDGHTLWAKGHQPMWAKKQGLSNITPWNVMVSSTQRPEWFGPVVNGHAYIRDVIRSIYNLSITKQEKVKLLHEYWTSLDEARPVKPIESVFEQWDQRLEEAPGQSSRKVTN